MPSLICSNCATPAAPLDWRCLVCGFPLELADLPRFDPARLDAGAWSLWRYAAMLPVAPRFTLGAGMTPLVETALDGVGFRAKLDYLNPSGSYKDRGTEVLLNHLLGQGVRAVVEDSSGNAGSSLALYGAGAGLSARIFAPASAPAAKKRQIALAAELVEVAGPRAAATDACLAAVARGEAVYATHAWSPYFIAGQMTLAWEIWEQLGRAAPGAVAMPLGQGGLLLGVARGFAALRDAGLIARLPALIAIQAAHADPVVRAFESGGTAPIPVETAPTVADGIVTADPVRGRAILTAIRESGGMALRVDEADILPARDALARRGLFVEPTSAVVGAALPRIRAHLAGRGEIVAILTGHGLKALG